VLLAYSTWRREQQQQRRKEDDNGVTLHVAAVLTTAEFRARQQLCKQFSEQLQQAWDKRWRYEFSSNFESVTIYNRDTRKPDILRVTKAKA
jgi:hypothetical protein